MAMLIDTHCHLDCEPLFGRLEQLLDEACAAGVSQWVVPGIRPEGWQGIQQLCHRTPGALPCFGIHPLASGAATDNQLAELEQMAPQAVAIGEIGLDQHVGDLARQETCFREQLRIAQRHNLPVLVHCRGAIARTLTILREERAERVGGIMHAFSGSLETARECMRLGFVISIAGTLTYQGARKPLQLARALPLTQLVLESDAPDLTPQRYKGHFNRPAWLVETARQLAELKGLSLDEVAATTTANAHRILKLGV